MLRRFLFDFPFFRLSPSPCLSFSPSFRPRLTPHSAGPIRKLRNQTSSLWFCKPK